MFPKNFAFCLWSPSFFFDCSLSLPLSLSDLLRASSSTDKIGLRQRPRRAAKLRVGKEKERVEGGRIQARRLGRVYKYVLLLARCRGGSPDLPVNFVIPFATSPNPFYQPSSVSLGANPLRNYGGASVMRVATGDAWWTVFLVCKRGDGEKWVVSKDARGLDLMCLTMI